jgi:hypothetical protein
MSELVTRSAATLAAVDLAELEATAALLVRRDRKYIVPERTASQLVERLAGRARVLQIGALRTFAYESVYFDTPGDACYLAAARRRPRRYKVRTRSYLDAGRCNLEIKTRDPRGRTVKERREHPIALRSRLDAGDLCYIGASPDVGEDAAELEPVLTTTYRRTTLVVDGTARVTIDTDVEARAPDGSRVRLTGMAIVETKSDGPPGDADRELWALGHRPTRVSKYCTCLAALRPELPANPWTRALREPWLVVAAVSPGERCSDLALAG